MAKLTQPHHSGDTWGVTNKEQATVAYTQQKKS